MVDAMEWSLSSWLILFSTLLVIAVVKLAVFVHRQSVYWKKRGVPSVPYSALGIMWKIVARREHFKDHLEYLYNYQLGAKYTGDVDLGTPFLFIRDPELIKDVTVKNFEYFTDHRVFIPEEADPLFGKNVFSLRGERWKEMRSTLSPSFTASKMRIMFELVSKCSHEFVDSLMEHPEKHSSIELKDTFRRYTTDVIATVAFGVNVNSMKDPNNEFFVRGNEVTKFDGLVNLVKFTLFRLCPRLLKLLGIGFISKSNERFFGKIVSETIRIRKEQGIVRPDMIHLLMQAADAEGSRLELIDIIAQAFIFFFAGFDTSSLLMCFMVHELAVNPDIQEKLREEVDRAIDEGNGEINYEMLSKMEYMDMVISETLRKYPPALFLDRLCVKDYTFPPATPEHREVTVEVDSMMWIPVYSLHHDPKYYPDPNKFDPERFSEANKANIVPYTYLPFGSGPRKCIGERFALMETKILTAHLLQKFIIKRSDKTVHPHVFMANSFNLNPKHGFWISLEIRKKGD